MSAAAAARVRAPMGRAGADRLYERRRCGTRILAVFDQTFAVTGVIKVIAVLVAIVGIFLALTALVIEREREIGVLRAIGASRGQVRGMLLSEAALLGMVASGVGNRGGDVPGDGADMGGEQGVLRVDHRIAMAVGDDRGRRRCGSWRRRCWRRWGRRGRRGGWR